jgi:hypothetical protein
LLNATLMSTKSQACVPPPKASSVPEPQKPMGWVHSLFQSKLRLERRGVQVHVLLDPPPPPPESPEVRRNQAIRQVRLELDTLLGHHAHTRQVVPHLSFVEQMLAKSGFRGIGRLPLPVLHKALTQLESLMHDEPGAGLAELRRRLAELISLRLGGTPSAPAAASAASSNLMSNFHTDDRMEVSEASHSQFDELERSWTGTLPEAMAAARQGG